MATLKSLFKKRVLLSGAVVGFVLGAVATLYFLGILIPRIRITLLLVLVAAIGALLYSVCRLALAALLKSPHADVGRSRQNLLLLGGVSSGLAVVCAGLLLLLPLVQATFANAEGNAGQGTASKSVDKADTMNAESRPTAVSAPTGQTTPSAEETEAALNNFFGELLRAGMQQQQRNKQSRQQWEQYNQCTTCGGAGNYRYVDSNGQLVVKPCPTCDGLGRRGALFGGGR